MTTKIESELNLACHDLREATNELAALGCNYEKERKVAQAKVTAATSKISALLSISKAASETTN